MLLTGDSYGSFPKSNLWCRWASRASGIRSKLNLSVVSPQVEERGRHWNSFDRRKREHGTVENRLRVLARARRLRQLTSYADSCDYGLSLLESCHESKKLDKSGTWPSLSISFC